MKITVAGVEKEVAEGLTITALIQQENVETPEYVTVSLNDEFVKREQFDILALKAGDQVEFLYFMGGGQ
jgi:sulfur carrier protein